jgi:hypothetical protein
MNNYISLNIDVTVTILAAFLSYSKKLSFEYKNVQIESLSMEIELIIQ